MAIFSKGFTFTGPYLESDSKTDPWVSFNLFLFFQTSEFNIACYVFEYVFHIIASSIVLMMQIHLWFQFKVNNNK